MTGARLVRAAALNHRLWFERRAGEVARAAGLRWAWSARARTIAVVLPPRVPRAGLDALVAFADARGAREVGAWWARPRWSPSLDAALHARGFQDGWAPHWMTARLAALPTAAPGIEPVGDAMGWEGVPYGESVGQVAAMRGAGQVGVPGAARAVVHLGAGVAGLYDVGVAPSQRRRGLGTAVTLAACAIARERGARHVVLNATWDGEQLYRAMGFQSLGHGMTWWRFPARR